MTTAKVAVIVRGDVDVKLIRLDQPAPPTDPGEPNTDGWTWKKNGTEGTVGDGNEYVVQGSTRTNAILKHPSLPLWLHTLRQGDQWSGGGQRNEIEVDRGAALANKTEQWWAFSYFVKDGPRVTSDWGPCLTQIHSNDFSYDAPPLFVSYTEDDTIRVVGDNESPAIDFGEFPTSREEWHDMLIRVQLDHEEGGSSICDVWHDRAIEPQVKMRGRTFGYPTGKWYRKFGTYREPVDESFDVYLTNHEFGTDLSYRIGNPAPVVIESVVA